MAAAIEKWKSELATLTPQDRAELAQFLLDTLEEGDDTGPDPSWEAEIQRRVAEIRSGQAVGKPAEQVFAEMREKHS